MKYYTIQNNRIYVAESEIALSRFYENVLPLPQDYENGKYIVEDNELVLNSNFEQEQAQKERERINMLTLTAADVERAIYKDKGMDFEDVIEFVKDMPEIDIKALKIELKANNFYRGNPYVGVIGNILGYSSDDLDYLFEHKEFPVEEENKSSLDELTELSQELGLYDKADNIEESEENQEQQANDDEVENET